MNGVTLRMATTERIVYRQDHMVGHLELEGIGYLSFYSNSFQLFPNRNLYIKVTLIFIICQACYKVFNQRLKIYRSQSLYNIKPAAFTESYKIIEYGDILFDSR